MITQENRAKKLKICRKSKVLLVKDGRQLPTKNKISKLEKLFISEYEEIIAKRNERKNQIFKNTKGGLNLVLNNIEDDNLIKSLNEQEAQLENKYSLLKIYYTI
ncbi:MAG TPA: hypothetical protein DIW25_01375 [Lactococcus garvieae]|uniref:hypothetical protein n=1 Tax=Lactococcus garvieae TaxID=1363 RepID=UPI000ED03954|nr:hypothetical protein [Lactococcus garvieae]HCS85247.1 hypothetical protein [Lactococcus garvieae]